MTRRAGALASLVAASLLPACREAASTLGPTPSEAATRADDLAGALASRFGPVVLEPSFASLRPKLARAAFLPSRVFDDDAWPARAGGRRAADFHGGRTAAGYGLGLRVAAPAPLRPADYRGALRLARRGPGQFEWSMREELAVGDVGAEDLARALTALFRAAQEAPGLDLRNRCRASLPRTAGALGRVFALEDLRLSPATAGGADVRLRAALDPSGLDGTFPRYARFLRRHVVPLRFRARLSDAGGLWWDVAVREGRVVLRARVHDRDLAPLEGPMRPMPERLRAIVDLSTRSGIFRVGFRRLQADVLLTRNSGEKGFDALFTRPPDWDLPLLVEPLLRAPLRRPFEGEGARFAFAVRDGAPTVLVREYRVAVQESWILRWLGALVGGAVEEFRRDAEAEADRFSGEVLWALRDDLVDLLSGSAVAR